MFTGSGFAQRFATTDGDLIDVYQATTQMTDESGQTYPLHAVTLLDNAHQPGLLRHVRGQPAHRRRAAARTGDHVATIDAAKARGRPGHQRQAAADLDRRPQRLELRRPRLERQHRRPDLHHHSGEPEPGVWRPCSPERRPPVARWRLS